ncbi:hypothetical protein ACVCH0_01520 [Burkholderia glumae]
MAVDFARLPPEEPGPDHPPSILIWTIVFFLIAIVGVFAVLLLWPKGESTQTPWFWACVTVYPFGLAAFVVLRRYSVYEGRRLDAIAWNDARKDYVPGVPLRDKRVCKPVWPTQGWSMRRHTRDGFNNCLLCGPSRESSPMSKVRHWNTSNEFPRE